MEIFTRILDVLKSLLISQTFWTAAAATGTVSTLYFIYKQIKNARAVTTYEFLRKEDDRFRSEEMRCKRSNLAKILLLKPNQYKEIDKYADYVLDYFEDLGMMLQKHLVPEYSMWAINCYYILRYWALLSKYADWVRKEWNDPTYYDGFEYLQKRILKFEKKATKKKKIDFGPNELREFLEEELQVQLRPFLHSDLDRVLEIEESSFSKAEAYPRSQFEELYKKHREGFFVAEILGEVIGYIIGYISDDIGEIDSVAVDSTFRHLGLGRSLTENLLEGFKEKGIKTFSLEVRTTNEVVIHFYKRMGFRIVKTFEGYYEDGSNAYLMGMDI